MTHIYVYVSRTSLFISLQSSIMRKLWSAIWYALYEFGIGESVSWKGLGKYPTGIWIIFTEFDGILQGRRTNQHSRPVAITAARRSSVATRAKCWHRLAAPPFGPTRDLLGISQQRRSTGIGGSVAGHERVWLDEYGAGSFGGQVSN